MRVYSFSAIPLDSANNRINDFSEINCNYPMAEDSLADYATFGVTDETEVTTFNVTREALEGMELTGITYKFTKAVLLEFPNAVNFQFNFKYQELPEPPQQQGQGENE